MMLKKKASFESLCLLSACGGHPDHHTLVPCVCYCSLWVHWLHWTVQRRPCEQMCACQCLFLTVSPVVNLGLDSTLLKEAIHSP